jgi:hypothetical protein
MLCSEMYASEENWLWAKASPRITCSLRKTMRNPSHQHSAKWSRSIAQLILSSSRDTLWKNMPYFDPPGFREGESVTLAHFSFKSKVTALNQQGSL